jgi:Glycosyl transferases group 1
MRVVFVHAMADWSGRGRIFAGVARALADRGYETWLAVPAGTEAAARAVAIGLSILPLPERRGGWRDARRMRALLPRDFVDVLFVHDEREHLAASIAARLAGRGMVVRRVPAGAAPGVGWRGRRAEQLAATRYLYTSESPPSGHAAPSGALTPMRAELGVAVPPPRPPNGELPALVCVATAESRRRTTNVLRAMSLLAQRHQDLRLRMLGSAAHDEDLRILASALGIAGRTEWTGHPVDRSAALRGAVAAWVIGEGDDAALGVLDCMAHGVAVLSERTPIVARYVSNGIHGMLMPQLDPPLMASETAVLLGDAERREAMGTAGRLRVEREFSEREMLAGFEQAVRAAREQGHRR